jgi:hypothetical protein
MNADFRRLGLDTLQINGTDPRTGGNWQPGKIHWTALDTARLLWLIDGAPDDDVLWQTPEGDPVTSAELSDSCGTYLKDLLAQQEYNKALTPKPSRHPISAPTNAQGWCTELPIPCLAFLPSYRIDGSIPKTEP